MSGTRGLLTPLSRPESSESALFSLKVPLNSRPDKKGPRQPVISFSEAKQAFDEGPGKASELPISLVPMHGAVVSNLKIRAPGGTPLEEYYRCQFIYALIHAGLVPSDHIGAEVNFPKGSPGSANLKVDAVIFDDPDWITHYNDYWTKGRNPADLQWLSEHVLAVVEFKRGGKSVQEAWIRQVKPAMREKDPGSAFVLGVYYDEGRLFLFERREGKYLRYDEKKNVGADLSLHLPDPYTYLPSVDELEALVSKPGTIDRAKRAITDLDVITSIDTLQVRDALSEVLRQMDRMGLVNQRGYEILVQTFALKIFDEKRNEKNPKDLLEFYVLDDESSFKALASKPAQAFISRLKGIQADASAEYERILSNPVINWKDEKQVRVIVSVCENFQDYSFIRSSKSDLYQLVFYNFANTFQQAEKAQFLTPLPVIDFLVRLVNPTQDETVFDPCCGIGDFLALSYVNSFAHGPLDDHNLFGADISSDMITLASLNMLLNGDGNARLFSVPELGSILWKIRTGATPTPIELLPSFHKGGDWENWPDSTKLMKFDVILTNPPFGEDRAFRPRSPFEKEVVEMYETWGLAGGDSIDLGVVFLENAVHSLKVGGRLGIVISNSIGSTEKWEKVRKWLASKMRIVATFDLPPNVFAETGVNTSLIVAYKATPKELAALQKQNYRVFVRDVENVGYMKRTAKRNVMFQPVYRIDPSTFEIEMDAEGNPILDEDFSRFVAEFREWAAAQETHLRQSFLKVP